jgi:hypothetical protein
MSIARQLLGKYVSATKSNNGTIVEKLCSLWAPHRGYITRILDSRVIELIEPLEVVVAVENWFESSRDGSWKIMEESREFS